MPSITDFMTFEKQLPSPALRPFVQEYSLRCVNVPPGFVFDKSMPVWSRSSIDFFLGGSISTIELNGARELPFSPGVFRGLRTRSRNFVRIEGEFKVLVVLLAPAGLYTLSGVPSSEFCDAVVEGDLLLKAFFAEMTGRLQSCSRLDECVCILEPALLRLAAANIGKAAPSPAVSALESRICCGPYPAPIASLLQPLALSQRQLERNFIREIGVTPKHYSRMVRFMKMADFRQRHPGMAWSALAYEFGYTDQMHLIRDFRHFLNITPGAFSAEDFACFDNLSFLSGANGGGG